MEYASFAKRLSIAILNYSIIFILFYILSFLLITLGLGKGDMQAAPFVVMTMAIAPLDFVVVSIMYPDGNEQITYTFLFIIMLLFEAIYFTITDILAIKKSNKGKAKMSDIILQDMNGNNPSFFKIFIRNILKSISRVLLMLPALTMLFTEKKQTLYDKMTNIVVR